MTTLFAASPTQSDLMTDLRAYLRSILPNDVEVFQGQGNRLPEPKGSEYVVMTPVLRDPLATTVHIFADCAFAGSIAGKTLTVSAVSFGVIEAGLPLFGAGVAAGTIIARALTGTGGIGAYELSVAQGAVSGRLAAGVKRVVQPVAVTVQLDIHTADPNAASDRAATLGALLADSHAFNFFVDAGHGVVPLYVSAPRQAPFINAEQQYETRWSIDLVLQTWQSIPVPQQFADSVTIAINPAA